MKRKQGGVAGCVLSFENSQSGLGLQEFDGTMRRFTPKRVYSLGKFLGPFEWGPILFHRWEGP